MEMNFQLIGNLISETLPEGWEKVKVFCQVSPESYEYFFYVKLNGEYIQNFDLEDTHKISRSEFRSLFKNLYNEMKEHQAEDDWKIATFIMNHAGEFKVNFDYDVMEVTPEYKDNWMKNYLD